MKKIIDYAKAAAFCREHWAEDCNRIIAIADAVCRNEFLFDMPWDMERTYVPVTFPDGNIDWGIMPSDDKEFIWQFNRHRYFIVLGQAYRLTGEVRYAENCVRLMSHWIDNVPCDEKYSNSMWRTLEVGLRGEYWTAAADLIDDTECFAAVKEKYLRSLAEHAKVLKRAHSYHMKNSNWGVIQDHGLLDISLELGDKEGVNTAIARLDEEISLQIGEDGVHREQSPMYHAEVLKCCLDAITRARASGIELPSSFTDRTREMCRAELKWMKPDGAHPLMGDSDDTCAKDILTQSAYLFRDGELKFGGYDRLDFESVWIFGAEADEEYRTIEVKKPQYTSVVLGDSGQVIMRSGFGESDNWLHFVSGGTSGGGHGHSDKLHIDLTFGGKDILTDSGRYTYVPKKERFELKSAMAHNTLTVDGRDYAGITPGSHAWNYYKTGFAVSGRTSLGGECEYAEGGHNGYGALVFRRVLWIKPDIYVIADTFFNKGLHKYASGFHFAKDCEVKSESCGLAVASGGVKLRFSFYSSAAGKLKIRKSRISYHYNLIEDNTTADFSTVTAGKCSHVCVIAPEGYSVKRETVIAPNGKKESGKTAQAFSISGEGKEYAVFLANKEITWIYSVGGKPVNGSVCVYKNGKIVMKKL